MAIHKGILGQQFGGATVQNDQTLGDYIHRKQRAVAFDEVAAEKKLTFEEWWKFRNFPDTHRGSCYEAWKAAQENK